MDAVRRIADAVLYEGYVLWPYRKSALKNQRRWTFGGVYPPAHSAAHPDDPALMRAECLAVSDSIDVSVRFLHVVRRQVLDAQLEPVEELGVGSERVVTWDEATEREVTVAASVPSAGEAGVARSVPIAGEAGVARSVPIAGEAGVARSVPIAGEAGVAASTPIAIEAGSTRETVPGGAVERSWRELRGTVEVRSVPAGGARRVSVTVRNETPWTGPDREDALRQTLCSTHMVLRGEFVSLTDPPERLRDAAAACGNIGCWPVLVGDRSTMLCSPIILEDYPQIAPESPGDLFDGGEIDQLLVLNILALTDEEKREMRETDPRAKEILERTESLSDAKLMRLHGRMR